MPPSCGCVIVASPLHVTVPAPSLPFLQTQCIITCHRHGALGGSLAWSPVHIPSTFLTASGLKSRLLATDVKLSTRYLGLFPLGSAIDSEGNARPFCLCNFYYFYYFIHSRVYLLIPDPTHGRFPALTSDLAEAFSCCVRHLSDITVDFLCVHLCVDLTHNHQGQGPDLFLSHSTCSVTVSWSICI